MLRTLGWIIFTAAALAAIYYTTKDDLPRPDDLYDFTDPYEDL